MAFDPNAPFEVAEPAAATPPAFDPNAAFEVAAPSPTPAQPGFWSQLGSDLERSFRQSRQAGQAIGADVADRFAGLQAQSRDPNSQLTGSLVRAFQQQTPQGAADVAATASGNLGDAIVGMGREQAALDQLPQRPVLEQIGNAGSFGDAGRAFVQDPVGAVVGVTAQSATQMLPGIAAALLGGPVIGAAAMGGTSAANEYGSTIVEELQQRGVNLQDEAAVRAVIAEPGFMDTVRRKARLRGSIIGGFDAASGGLAGASLVPQRAVARPVAREAANLLVAQPLAQAALGAGGEAAAQVATGEWKPGQIFLEAIGELGGAPGEAAAFSRQRLTEQYRTWAASRQRDPASITTADLAGAAAQGDADALAILRSAGMTEAQIRALSPERAQAFAGRIQERRETDADPAAQGDARLLRGDPAQRAAEGQAPRGDRSTLREASELFQRAQRATENNDPAALGPQEQPPASFQVTPSGAAVPLDAEGRMTDEARSTNEGMRGRARPEGYGALVPTEPQPNRMTPGEIARAQAQNEGGQQGGPGQEPMQEPPPRMVAPEGRAPQTPTQVQEQRQAGEAFALAGRQRDRAGPDVRDTQPAGRPEGPNAQTVYLDEGFPVRILGRDDRGFVSVERYDPRTGEPAEGAVPYVVRAEALTSRDYSVDPRRAQDVFQRSQGPAPPEGGRMPNDGVVRMPEQTYRTTTPDPDVPGAEGPTERIRPNTPGAGQDDGPWRPFAPQGPSTRASRPEQRQGPGGYRRYSTAEEAMRDFQQRRAQAEAEAEQTRARGEWTNNQRSTNTPGAQDAEGRWPVDQNMHVVSSTGGPIIFGDQKQAGIWIIKEGQRQSPDQIFQIAVHPSGRGFTVKEVGRSQNPGGAGAGASRSRPSDAGQGAARDTSTRAAPDQPLRLEGPRDNAAQNPRPPGPSPAPPSQGGGGNAAPTDERPTGDRTNPTASVEETRRGLEVDRADLAALEAAIAQRVDPNTGKPISTARLNAMRGEAQQLRDSIMEARSFLAGVSAGQEFPSEVTAGDPGPHPSMTRMEAPAPSDPATRPAAQDMLLICSCSTSKSDAAGEIPAAERYTGAWFKQINAIPEGERPTVLILSGKFGLIDGSQLIPNYDQAMDKARATAVAADEDVTGRRLQQYLEEGEFSSVVIAAGGEYRRALAPHLQAAEESGLLPDVRDIRGRGIGDMQSELGGVLRRNMVDAIARQDGAAQPEPSTEPDPPAVPPPPPSPPRPAEQRRLGAEARDRAAQQIRDVAAGMQELPKAAADYAGKASADREFMKREIEDAFTLGAVDEGADKGIERPRGAGASGMASIPSAKDSARYRAQVVDRVGTRMERSRTETPAQRSAREKHEGRLEAAYQDGREWARANPEAVQERQVTTETARGRKTRYSFRSGKNAAETADRVAKAPGATFYSNPLADPEAWRRFVVDPIRNLAGQDRNQTNVLERIPELEAAAKGVREGTVTRERYNELVRQFKPVRPYEFVPPAATEADMQRGLKANQQPLIGAPSDRLQEGDPVGLRLDIPAYANHGVWVVSVHEQQAGFKAGTAIGYEPVASVTGATMGVSGKAALSIAEGTPKGTIAVIKGAWRPIDPVAARQRAQQALRDPAWVQVGMDPTRASFFYDRRDMRPITAADEVIQVGPLVLAKNPTYDDNGAYLYANPLADPAAWKRFIGDPLRAWLRPAAQAAGNAGRVFRNALEAVVSSSDGQERVRAARYTDEARQLYDDVLNMLHATAGRGDGAAETYSEAMLRGLSRSAEVEKLQKAWKAAGFTDEQVREAVLNPRRTVNPELRRQAEAVRAFFRDELQFARDAGVDVTDWGSTYVPRVFDRSAILTNPDQFLQRAEAEYRRTGMPPEEARVAAQELLLDIQAEGVGALDGKGRGFRAGGSSFTVGRSFGAGVEGADRLGPFYVKDLGTAMAEYTHRVTKRAEIARRFGDRFKGWADIRKGLIDAGVTPTDVESLESHVAVATGTYMHSIPHGLRNTLDWARTISTLSTLDQSFIINLSELLMGGVRTGNLGDTLKGLMKAGQQTARELRGAPRDVHAEHAEDLGIIGGHLQNAIMAARFASGDVQGQRQSETLSKFFRGIGMEQLTNGTRVGVMQVGRSFLDRLARDVRGESAWASWRSSNAQLSRRYLAELGVPAAKAESFSQWLGQLNGGYPTPAQLRTESGQLYITAMRRFADQGVQRPDPTTRPRWASHPLGAAVFTLQSYTYAFTKNVLLRSLRLAKAAGTEGGYSPVERVAMLAPLMLTLPIFALGNIALQELRKNWTGDPDQDRRMTDRARTEETVIQSGMLGAAQTWVEMPRAVMFNKDMVTAGFGPVFQLGASVLNDMGRYFLDNSPRTNTQERRLARSTYRAVVEPATQLAMNAMPGAGMAASVAKTAVRYGIGTRAAQDRAVDEVAGRERAAERVRRLSRPIEGLTERIGNGGARR